MTDDFETEQKNYPHQRRHPRVEIPLLVQYRYGAAAPMHIDYTLNVSNEGLFILTDEEQPIGTRVIVHITTRDSQEIIHGEGTVVRVGGSEKGLGISLDQFSDEARRGLERVVAQILEGRKDESGGDALKHVRSWEAKLYDASTRTSTEGTPIRDTKRNLDRD